MTGCGDRGWPTRSFALVTATSGEGEPSPEGSNGDTNDQDDNQIGIGSDVAAHVGERRRGSRERQRLGEIGVALPWNGCTMAGVAINHEEIEVDRDEAVRANERVGEAINWVQSAKGRLQRINSDHASEATREAFITLEVIERSLYSDASSRTAQLAALDIPQQING